MTRCSRHADGCTRVTVVSMPKETSSQTRIIRPQLRLAVVQCDILCSYFAITAVEIKIQTAKKKLCEYIHKWASYHSESVYEIKMIGVFLAQQD